jgi:subtilisin family serine protease
MLVLVAMLWSGHGAFAASPAAEPTSPYVVVLADGADVDQRVGGFARSLGIRASQTYRHAIPGFAAHLSDRQLAALRADPAVRFIEPDRPIQLTAQTLPTGINRVDAELSPVAKIDGVDSRVDADIAIIDSGIQADLPDLNVAGGVNCVPTEPDWSDGFAHGTHVAGVAAALDNGYGVVGVAPGARVWSVRVFDRNGFSLLSWIVCGIDWVTGQRDPQDSSRPLFEVANMSLRDAGSDDGNCGLNSGDAEHRAICASVASGVTYAVSSGNDGTDSSRWIPAAYPEVITVSALADFNGQPGGGAASTCASFSSSDADDTFADFSNYGPAVDLIAPGKCILSTYPTTKDASGYRVLSGTSMASPHVAGAVALYKALFPYATPADVRNALRATGSGDWITSSDPDGTHEPLLNVSNLASAPPPVDFSISASPTSLSIDQGGTATSTISTRIVGSSGTVRLTATVSPSGAGVTATLGADSVTAGKGTTLRIGAASGAQTGGYTVNVKGTEGTKVHSTAVSVTVRAPSPDPTPTPTPTPSPGTGATYVAVTPNRILDSRFGNGLSGRFQAGIPRTFQVTNRNTGNSALNVPSTAIAVTGNLTVTEQTAAGWLTVTPTADGDPPTSTLNFPVGDNRANGVTVPLGAGGLLSIVYNGAPSAATTHVIFDVTGYFLPGTSGARYVALTPNRLLDSRFGTGLSGRFGTGIPRSFQVANRNGGSGSLNVPSTAIAVTGNLTVTGQTNAGWLTVTPTADGNPPTSTLNFPVGDNRANGVTVPLGSGGTLSVVYNGGPSAATTDAIFDVTGYFLPGAMGARYFALTPNRILDSRFGNGLSGTLHTGGARSVAVTNRAVGDAARNVPSAAAGVTGNLTVTGQTRAGWLTVTPSPESDPPTSTLNFPVGDNRANTVDVALSGGSLSIVYNGGFGSDTTHAIFDVTGYFAP